MHGLGGNWVDLVLLLVLLYFILTNKGFLTTFLEIVGFMFSLFFSYKFYGFFGRLLALNFSFPRGVGNAVGFFIAWFLSETIFFFAIYNMRAIKEFLHRGHKDSWNISFGFLAGALQGAIVFLFFISLVFALPVRGKIKQDVLNSKSGPFFVGLSHLFETRLKEAFGGAVTETLNFLTVKQGSQETIGLGFDAPKKILSPDPQSEAIMLGLVNKERSERGLSTLEPDEGLREVSRQYAMEMFTHGFFSHISEVDGSDAGQRVSRAGISYEVLGENLAFAPDVYVAHQGLMNSEGHRENILLPDYRRVGIGVIDGGVYGKMFVQLFSN